MENDSEKKRKQIPSKEVNKIISERTGLAPNVISLVLEEYGMYIMENVYVKRRCVSLFGLVRMKVKDIGHVTVKGIYILPRLRMSYKNSPKVLKLMKKLNGEIDQGIEMPKDYKAYIQQQLEKFRRID